MPPSRALPGHSADADWGRSRSSSTSAWKISGAIRTPLPDADLQRIARSVARYAPGSPSENAVAGTSPAKKSTGADGASPETARAEIAPEVLAAASVKNLTDLGNARRLVERHGRDLRYVPAWKCWQVWDGQRWGRDDTGEVVRRAKETATSMLAEASAGADEDRRKVLAKHALKTEGDPRIRAMISLAASEPGIPVSPADMDTDALLLNVSNGTLELRTCELRAHRREDLLTKLVPVAYDPEALSPTWLSFLQRSMDGDVAMVEFLQMAAGYSLTGSTSEQVCFIGHGSGANGKSTFVRTLTDLGADYATWTPTQTLLARQGERIDNDLARLRGARMVVAVETSGGRRLAEALVKQLTGGDRVTARFLFGEFFEFTPQFKLWLMTNHRPEIRGTDHAIWRRIRLIPFTVTIPPAEQDPELPEKLRAEFPGILRWAVEGCRIWRKEGLGTPMPVLDATAAYRATMDQIGSFLRECCEQEAEAKVGATELYKAYLAWCESNRESEQSQRRFGEGLAERGFKTERNSVTNRIVRVGLRLAPNLS